MFQAAQSVAFRHEECDHCFERDKMGERPRFWYPPKILSLLLLGSGLVIGSGLLLFFLGSRGGPRSVQLVVWGIGLLGVFIGGAGCDLGFY